MRAWMFRSCQGPTEAPFVIKPGELICETANPDGSQFKIMHSIPALEVVDIFPTGKETSRLVKKDGSTMEIVERAAALQGRLKKAKREALLLLNRSTKLPELPE